VALDEKPHDWLVAAKDGLVEWRRAVAYLYSMLGSGMKTTNTHALRSDYLSA